MIRIEVGRLSRKVILTGLAANVGFVCAQLTIPAALNLDALAENSSPASVENAPAPSVLDKQLADSVKGIWAKASIIYAKAYLLPDNENSTESATLKAINTLGPKAWTQEKIEQLLVVAGVHNKKFKSILVQYIKNLPETYTKPVQGRDTGAKNPIDSAKAEAQSDDLAGQLCTIPEPYKERMVKLLGPVSRSTKAALVEVSHRTANCSEQPAAADNEPKVQASVSASSTKIQGQTYFDDIDSLFEETRTQIDKNFSKFSNADQQEDLTKKLLNTPVQEKAMSNDMKSTSTSAVQQFGNYKSSVQQVQTMLETSK